MTQTRKHSSAGWAPGALLALLLTAPLLGCARSPRPTVSPIAALELVPEERLGVDDVFEVRVYGEQELSGLYRVSVDGTIDYPYVGRVKVVDMGSGEVQDVIARRLREGFLKNPQVSVMVKEWNSRKISVIGQVQKPGSVPYFPGMTVVDAIAAAGGFTPIAAQNTVTLRREKEGRVESRTCRVGEISAGTSPNVAILPGDRVFVEERLF
jgi:protein involved in polysaccharide export with SLBB domain